MALGGTKWLGWGLLFHFCLVCWLKVSTGHMGDLLWVSHVSLLLAGLGCVLGWCVLLEVGLVLILVPHAFWMVDFLCWFWGGVSPLGLTRWLEGASGLVWLSTGHHFYLSGLLLWLCWSRGGFEMISLWLAGAVFLWLTVLARWVTEPADNVDWVFGVLSGMDGGLVGWVNRLRGEVYLLCLNAVVTGLMFWPSGLLLRWVCGRRRIT